MDRAVSCATAAAALILCCAFQGDQNIRQLLHRQGFSSELFDGGATITKLCTMSVSGTSYDFYRYEHVNPHPAHLSIHGIQALVEVRDGKSYIGMYLLPITTPTCDTQAKEIVLTSNRGQIDRIAVGAAGLPQRALVDGENLTLHK